jgi:Domain of unknown function (DUF4159)
MNHRTRCSVVAATLLAMTVSRGVSMVSAADLSGAAVKEAIERGKKFLKARQGQNGSWDVGQDQYRVGVTSMALLALINSGMTPQDDEVKQGLKYLRSLRPAEIQIHCETYQVSLMIMALAAAKDGKTDIVRITNLAQRLEGGQIKQGVSGCWTYSLGEGSFGGGDPSNTQFAVLGLREAVEAGAVVNRDTWQRARDYWVRAQNGDGGWSYSSVGNQGGSTGSMTVAGVSSMAICEQMLRSDDGVAPDGTPPCCQTAEPNKELERGIAWLGRNFAVTHNPGDGSNSWGFYYIYGVERAGRLSGQRFFGDHDWYREGAAFLVATQNGPDGAWPGSGNVERHPVVGTSMALLFLSKGLAPVLINKLKYGPRDPGRKDEVLGDDWNRHRRDVRNLTELISGLPKWPKLLTTQDLDIARAVETGGVNNLLQAPVLFITGEKSPQFAPAELKLLKEYIQEGGFIFASPTCQSTDFEAGFRAVVKEIMPPGEGELKRLPPDHPVYKSEYLLQQDGTPLFGVDFGCRTSVMYCSEDLGCLWDYWARQDPPNRNVNLKARIIRATHIGVNVMAYATGREPPHKTDAPQKVAENTELDNVERGLLQIAQIRHDGAWNAAPRALRNLLMALNENYALAASTKPHDFALSDPNIFQYPVLYMHGRNKFAMGADDRRQLREYLDRGGVLFADACCGSKPFDKSFREFVADLYPDKKLTRIPIEHDLFTEKIGRDIRRLKRRTTEGGEIAVGSTFTVKDAEPFVEGLEVDGRLAVIYSKYDISCALERQSAGNCEGYLPEDAVKLATNIILYSLLQDLNLKPKAESVAP